MSKLLCGLPLVVFILFSSAGLTYGQSKSIANIAYRYKSKSGKVYLVINRSLSASSKIYISKFVVRATNCQVVLHPGEIQGMLNTRVSVNWASFSWPDWYGRISGLIAYSNVHSYAQSYVQWPTLASANCYVPAGRKMIFLIN